MTETDPLDFLQVDRLLSDDERAIRDRVRRSSPSMCSRTSRVVRARRIPVELSKGFGELGVLGMHLEGTGVRASRR